MSEISRIIDRIQQGESFAAEQLLPLVYDELRRLAVEKLVQERPGQTLQATALVHEAYLRLVDTENAQRWESRRHFFAAAAEAMRRILVESARRKQSHKHGGGLVRQEAGSEALFVEDARDPVEVLDVQDALEQLAAKSPRRAELVKLRYFLGCTLPEAAEILGIAPATAEEDWTHAKAWLRRRLGRPDRQKPAP